MDELDLELLEDETLEELRLEEPDLELLEDDTLEELRLEELDLERLGVETREELRLEGLETDGDGRLVLGALRTRDEDRDDEGCEGVETRDELRPEGLETDGDGRLVLGALRTRDEDRDDEGREGVETREELLGANRGDGRADGADGTEGEDCDTDSAWRGGELAEGAPRGIVPWVAARRLKRRQRSSAFDRLPPSGRAAVGC